MKSTEILRRYINIVNKTQNAWRLTEDHMITKDEAHYTPNSPGADTCGQCDNFRSPNRCQVVLGTITPSGWCKYYTSEAPNHLAEKWDKPTKVSPEEKGKYAGKTKAELLKSYNALKKSGPHKKGSAEYGRMRELAFAIRAKGGWGKVAEE